MAWKSDEPPADQGVFDIGSLEAELFWQKHRRTIFFSGAAAIIAVLAAALWLFAQYRARHAAQALFADAQNQAAWREVIAKYPASAAAASAHFLLAESLRSEGKLKESSSEYEAFLSAFPKSTLVGGARLGLAENLAVAAQRQESLEAMRELQAKDPASYAALFAALLEGRALVGMGKLEEARKVFSQLVSTYPQSPPGRTAGAQLDALAPFLSPDSQKSAQ
jgi:TolA-binding protein